MPGTRPLLSTAPKDRIMTLATRLFPARGPALPPVVLLHGFASSAAEDFVATGWPEALNAAGRSVIAIDLPGHGENPAIESADQATTGAVISAILDAAANAAGGLGAAPDSELDVVAYSLGARLGWELPSASPRIGRLVLGGLSPFEPFAAVDPAELASALAGEGSGDPLTGMMAMMISAPGRDTASLAQLIPGLASQPFAPAQGGPRVPTLFVAGDADEMAEGVEALAAGLPQAELISVPGDHRGALDSPEFRVAAIEFLTR